MEEGQGTLILNGAQKGIEFPLPSGYNRRDHVQPRFRREEPPLKLKLGEKGKGPLFSAGRGKRGVK